MRHYTKNDDAKKRWRTSQTQAAKLKQSQFWGEDEDVVGDYDFTPVLDIKIGKFTHSFIPESLDDILMLQREVAILAMDYAIHAHIKAKQKRMQAVLS